MMDIQTCDWMLDTTYDIFRLRNLLRAVFQSSEKESSMDSNVMHRRGNTNGAELRIHLPRWLAPVQLVAVALWHGIKAVW